ncbi:MAG: hypothetical protein NTV11_06190 [Rhodocyclales bacterium]|nr:hypothetical protein [Rhodocyclales bacterium]
MNAVSANDAVPTPPVDYEVRPLSAATDSRRLMALVGQGLIPDWRFLFAAELRKRRKVAQLPSGSSDSSDGNLLPL